MSNWPAGALDDDVRPRMFDLAANGTTYVLATITAAEGGPRPVGAQMVVTDSAAWGFLSGGCIEADIALHGREVLVDGDPRRLIYGRGSPFIDMRLPCGGRLEVLVERVLPDDPAVARLAGFTAARQPAGWTSDGRFRRCWRSAPGRLRCDGDVSLTYSPIQRVIAIGSDPFALAIAALAAQMGWEATLVAPFGPQTPPPFPIRYVRSSIKHAMHELTPDCWTALAVATHDIDLDHDALAAALNSRAGYIGVLGARKRIPERRALLRSSGFSEEAIARLKMPIGLDLGAATAWEVAVAVVAEIVANRRCPEPVIQSRRERTRAVGSGDHASAH